MILKGWKAVALSLAAVFLLAFGAVGPAAAIPPTTPAPNFTMTGTPAILGATYAIVYNGNLWVSDYASDHVYEYLGPTYTANEAPSVTLTVTEPQQLTFDASGNLWVGTWVGHVYEYSAPVANAASPSITLSGLSGPTGVTLHAGSLWVFDWGADKIYQYNPVPSSNSASPPTAILSPAFEPMGGVFDSSGNLWVAQYSPGQVVEYAGPVIIMGESISATLVPPGSPAEVSGVALDGSGNLWVSSPRNTGLISEFTAPLTNGETGTSEITSLSTDSFWGVTIDTSGNVWVGDYNQAAVYEYGGLVSSAPNFPSTLPPTTPTTLKFSFSSSSGTAPSPITGKLVALQGGVIQYNLPGYKPTAGVTPYALSACLISASSEIRITGFENYQAGTNSSEVIVSNWFTILTNAQGWPTEPSC